MEEDMSECVVSSPSSSEGIQTEAPVWDEFGSGTLTNDMDQGSPRGELMR